MNIQVKARNPATSDFSILVSLEDLNTIQKNPNARERKENDVLNYAQFTPKSYTLARACQSLPVVQSVKVVDGWTKWTNLM